MTEYNTNDKKNDKDSQLKVLIEENKELLKQVNDLKKTLDIYGIEELETMSDAESICVTQINRIKELAERVVLTPEEVKVFDILVKNLLLIRGKDIKKTLGGKQKSAAELISIVREELGDESEG